MQLCAITLARVLGFIETFDLNPRGTVFFPDILEPIVERFRFIKFPQKPEDFDEQKGVEFVEGTWEGVNVERLIIYTNGILLDTRAGTTESERILEESLLWAAGQFKLQYKPGSLNRKRYLSDLTFHSDAPILKAHAAFSNLAKSLQDMLEETTGSKLSYEPTRLDVDFSRHENQKPLAPFTIQRRAEMPFSENRYFSEAPLQTDEHIAILKAFEADISASR